MSADPKITMLYPSSCPLAEIASPEKSEIHDWQNGALVERHIYTIGNYVIEIEEPAREIEN